MRHIFLLLLGIFPAFALAQSPIKVNMFPGAQALPVVAAVSQGIFDRQGLKVEALFTVNSQEQREGLARGAFQIAQAAVDNAVAMVELAKAAMLNLPFSLDAKAAGLKSMAALRMSSARIRRTAPLCCANGRRRTATSSSAISPA